MTSTMVKLSEFVLGKPYQYKFFVAGITEKKPHLLMRMGALIDGFFTLTPNYTTIDTTDYSSETFFYTSIRGESDGAVSKKSLIAFVALIALSIFPKTRTVGLSLAATIASIKFSYRFALFGTISNIALDETDVPLPPSTFGHSIKNFLCKASIFTLGMPYQYKENSFFLWRALGKIDSFFTISNRLQLEDMDKSRLIAVRKLSTRDAFAGASIIILIALSIFSKTRTVGLSLAALVALIKCISRCHLDRLRDPDCSSHPLTTTYHQEDKVQNYQLSRSIPSFIENEFSYAFTPEYRLDDTLNWPKTLQRLETHVRVIQKLLAHKEVHLCTKDANKSYESLIGNDEGTSGLLKHWKEWFETIKNGIAEQEIQPIIKQLLASNQLHRKLIGLCLIYQLDNIVEDHINQFFGCIKYIHNKLASFEEDICPLVNISLMRFLINLELASSTKVSDEKELKDIKEYFYYNCKALRDSTPLYRELLPPLKEEEAI